MDFVTTKRVLREHLTGLTKELIRFPSHIGEARKIFELADFIKDYFAKDGLIINEFVINGVPALVISTEDTRHPHIMLSGHMDVVPSSYVYSAKQEGDWLYGSGAMDMKSGIACMMAVMKFFAREKDRPSLAAMITGDEETGGEAAETLLNGEGYGADFCIVNESRHKYEIVNREKGLLVLDITVKGKPIHSAYPWKGKNAVEELMRVCLNVKKHFPRVREGWSPNVSVTNFTVRVGEEINTIPGEAGATMFFRLTEKRRWTRESILALVRRLAPAAEVRELVYGDVFDMDPKNFHINLLRETASHITGKKIGFGTNHGGSDARFFAQKNIPTAILGPVGKDHHTPEECVSIESMVTHFKVLQKFIARDLV